MDNLDFIVKVKGLAVNVDILSEIPAGYIPVWDFGVYNGTTEDNHFNYESSGRYIIKLYLSNDDGKELVGSKPVMVSDHVNTQLTDSIYNLINKYIPEDLNIKISMADKESYIKKWQLYIQPLVNHDVPIEEYSNELYYEGLENQLVMELAVYDYLYIQLQRMIIQTANQLNNMVIGSESSEEGSNGRDRIKQITTGPTEVQYFDTVTESVSSLFKAYTTATQPGGILDDLRKNLCMLSKRMDIYLPLCDKPISIKVPEVVNRRSPGIIGGPNPGSLVKLHKDSIL